MELLIKVFTDYKFWLTIFGAIVNFAFMIINKTENGKLGTPIKLDFTFIFYIITYVLIGSFSYIFFYEDIQSGSMKVAIMIGLSSFYFIGKTIASIGKKQQ
jgi:uncharacterized membrane protein